MDVFSLGCIFYYTLTDGMHPFGSPKHMIEANIMQRIFEVDILSIKSNQSGSIHLILSMLQHLPIDRPSCSTILSHHFFWSPKRVFNFIGDICSIVESKFDRKQDCLQWKVESSETTFCQKEWRIKLESEVNDFIDSSMPKYSKDDCPALSLLKSINYVHQNEYLPPGVLKFVGKSSSDQCDYWLGNTRFPYLITLIWISCCAIDEKRFREKYNLLASEFSKTNNEIKILTPTKYISKIKVGNINNLAYFFCLQ